MSRGRDVILALFHSSSAKKMSLSNRFAKVEQNFSKGNPRGTNIEHRRVVYSWVLFEGAT